jgi:UDP-2-acetamido-3-amino-2,3-dideoxy-glucuronate N-acetyltransferase
MTNYFVHESSYIDDHVVIGEGTKIWHFCHVQSGANEVHPISLNKVI